MNREIANALSTLLVKSKVSDAGKIVRKFDSSRASKPLLDFLGLHPSCRAVFNAMVKSGSFNLLEILPRLEKIAGDAGTSFMFAAKCKKCKKMIDLVNLADHDFESEGRRLDCVECGQLNTLAASDYTAFYKFNKGSLIRLLKRGEGTGFLTLYATIECPYCGHTDTLSHEDVESVNLRCPKCNGLCEALIKYIPTHLDELSPLLNERQGYWLEWYVWKLVSKNYPADAGLELSRGGQKIEADVVFLNGAKISVVECRDTSDAGDLLKKVPVLKDLASKIFIASTTSIEQRTLQAAKDALGDKMVYVNSRELENICGIIQKSFFRRISP